MIKHPVMLEKFMEQSGINFIQYLPKFGSEVDRKSEG